jgi:ATP-binding cassette subfamily B protein
MNPVQPMRQQPPPGHGLPGVRAAFRRFWPLTAGDRRWMVLVCVCALLAALSETAAILLFAQLTDGALQHGSLRDFWTPAGQWLAVAVLAALAGYLGNSLSAWLAERFVLRLRAKVFSHLQTLPPHFFQRQRQGDLVERLTGDVEAIEQLAVSGILQGVTATLSALLYAAAALWLRWDLALATFLLAPLFWLAAHRLSGRLTSVSYQERAADGAITAVVNEALDNLVLTQAYNRQQAEEKRLDRAARSWMRAAVSGARLNERYEQSVEVIETFCVLAIIGMGAWEISAGRMTLGQLLAFAAFVGYLYPPIRSLGSLGLAATAATAGAERLLEILDTPPSVTDPVPATPVPVSSPVSSPVPHRSERTGGRLELRGVGFGYPGVARQVLRDVSFTAEPGEVLLVTGPSGAGKSTLAALLLRFYDPDQGSVRLDGTPLHALPLSRLREKVTLLSQHTHILRDSVRENIACGRPDATDQQVRQAAEAVGAHEFIAGLPDGYDTPLAPHTTRLSGGQLQRITIARAMLRDTPVLVLDEPTTGLDTLTVQALLPALRRLATGRTTLIVSHDLEVAAVADRVLVLDHGRLAESGTHSQLMADGGLYASLHR